MKGGALFFLASAALFAAGAALAVWLVPGAGVREAVWTSAAIALVVQLFTFAIARLTQGSNILLGWGLGALLRMVTLVVYALLVTRALGFPLAPALLSLMAFLFVSTVIEPLLLKL